MRASFQILACAARRAGSDGFGRTGNDYAAAGITPARAHVDDIVGVADHVEVMLDHYDRGATVEQLLEHTEQHTNTASSCLRPISEASLSLWASPPESAGVASPRVR